MREGQFNPSNSIKRSCPVCESLETVHYRHHQFSDSFDGSLLSSYDVVACQECGFGFADHIPPQSVIDQYYASFSKYEQGYIGGSGSSYDTKRFQAISDSIVQTLPSMQSSVLDIGCATGELLGILKGRGCPNVIGLDPSPNCSLTAERLYGVQVQTGNIFEFQAFENKFEYVIMIGVLEHIHDLAIAFKQLKEILSPFGRILIEVPDVTRFANYPDAPFQQFSTEHIDFFSPVSLENLLGVNGFRQISFERFERPQSASTIMPVIIGVYEISSDHTFQIRKDNETGSALEQYIYQSMTTDEEIKESIATLVKDRTSVIIWGVGTHTLRLLCESQLSEGKITAFVDSNPKYWGMELKGIPVLAPQAIQDRGEVILISSRVHQDAIERIIRDDLRMQNKIIKLYRF